MVFNLMITTKVPYLNAIKTEMTEKGYKFQKEGGDMVISIFITLDDKTSYRHIPIIMVDGPVMVADGDTMVLVMAMDMGRDYSTTTVTENNYQEGTLIIDIFNAADKKLIWQGIGSKEVQTDLDKRDQELPKNVGKILANFPTIKLK